MKDMQRIIDLKWVPWTYASVVSLVVGVWAGGRFPKMSQYGDPTYNGGAFVLGLVLGFAAASPLLLAFYVASRMVDNQVALGTRVAGPARDGAAVGEGAGTAALDSEA